MHVVRQRGSLMPWTVGLLFLLLHGIVSTCLPAKLDPLSTLCIVLAEVAAMAAAIRASSKADPAMRLLWWLLAAAVMFHSTAMSLDFVMEATDAPVLNYVPGLSIFFSMLYSVPLLAAVPCSSTDVSCE